MLFRDKFSYSPHHTMYMQHTSVSENFNKICHGKYFLPRSISLEKGGQNSPWLDFTLGTRPKRCLDSSWTSSLSTSATFAVFTLISNLWSNISHVKLTSSSLTHRFLKLLAVSKWWVSDRGSGWTFCECISDTAD